MKNKRNKRKHKKQEKQLISELDPKWRTRLPDWHTNVIETPGTPARAMTLDYDEDGTISTLKVILPEGSRPKKTILRATKDVTILGTFGQRVVPEKCHIETIRKRQSGSDKPKVLSIIPGTPDKLTINPGYIFEHFDAVVALDTNTNPNRIGGDTVSVLGVALSKLSPLEYPRLVHITSSHAIEFRNLSEPREKFGWAFGLDAMYRNGLLSTDWKVVVIVDAYANEIMSINDSRELINGIMLPNNVQLAYASSDTAQLFSVNKCIRAADMFAARVMKALSDDIRLHHLTPLESTLPFSAIRFWQATEDERGYHLRGVIPKFGGTQSP